MKKTTIYFLRHGDVANPQKILYGRLPRFALSFKGRKKIEKVAKQFRNKKIKHLYSSPLLRARQTAVILAKELKLTPRISYLINEVKLIYTGMPLEIFKAKYQQNLYSRTNVARGQESVERIASRMLKFMRILKRRHYGDNLLVVSHGDPLLILKAKVLGLDFTTKFKKANYLKTGEWFTLVLN